MTRTVITEPALSRGLNKMEMCGEVAAMTYPTRIEPEVVEVMRRLVEVAEEHIFRVALADAGKALFAEVQAMSAEKRMALPTGIQISLPSGDLHGDIGRKR